MKLKDLLSNEDLSYLKILTDDSTLEAETFSIESTETPDAYNYISKYSLVITTALAFKDNQEGLIEFINQLAISKSSALAIKVDRFLKSLHQNIIDHCNKLNFCLILIPEYKTLGNVYHDLLKKLWDDNQDSLNFALNSQRIFSDTLLKKPNFQIVLYTLYSILESDVALTDAFGEHINSTNNFLSIFEKDQIIDCINTCKKMAKTRCSFNLVDKNNMNKKVFLHKINVGHNYNYYLFILSSDKFNIKMNKFVIDQAIFAINFTIISHLNNNLFDLQKTEKVFDNLLYFAEKSDEKEYLDLTRNLSLNITSNGRFGIISFSNFENFFPLHLQMEGYVIVYNHLKKYLSKYDDYSIIPMTLYKYFLIHSKHQKLDVLMKDLLNIINDIVKTIKLDYQITIGPRYFTYKSMKESVFETINAVDNGIVHKLYKNVKISRPQNYQRLFSLISNNQKDYFYESTLKKLAENTPQNIELRSTLRAWLLNQTNVKKTAEQLFLHRNTVNYRIEKCKEILESDLTDNVELFHLEIALNLFEE